MQTWRWYLSRLRAMPPREIAWRVKGVLRDQADRWLLARRQRHRPIGELVSAGSGDKHVRLNYRPTDGEFNPAWRQRLIEKADRIAEGRLSFFDLNDVSLGEPIDWHRDHKRGMSAPRTFAPAIDYRDVTIAGDCKFVWEPNRLHQLVVLGQAYRLTGDARYAAAAVSQVESWLGENPYGIGMNWRSPLELAIRIINLAWLVDLIADSGLIVGPFRERLLNAAHLHLWEIARKFSRGSSANNHLVGEAAGVFVGASYFAELAQSPGWRQVSRQILCEEILNQTYPDGGPREQAFGYHLFILQFFLVAGWVGRLTGQDFPKAYWDRLERMFEFAAAMIEAGPESGCNFGDGDDGYVLDLGGDRGDARPWLAVGAVLFDQPRLAAVAGEFSAAGAWLLGSAGRAKFESIAASRRCDTLCSQAFPDSGYYLLQHGSAGPGDGASVLFDCGPLGLGQLAAHGHADALSFTLRVGGREILVDPGTFDYFSYPEWRNYFRSTAAHNAVVIDEQNQSQMLGRFQWGRRAAAKCIEWQPTPQGGRVVGEHDGYRALRDPAVHRRTVELDGGAGRLLIRDEIIAKGRHEVAACFHFAESCRVIAVSANTYQIDVDGAGAAPMLFTVPAQLTVSVLRGSDDPPGGWVSRGYHQKRPATTLVCRGQSQGNARLDFELDLGRSQREPEPAVAVTVQEAQSL